MLALAPPTGSMSLLVAFVQYGMTTWPDEFTALLASAGDRPVRAATPPVRGCCARAHRYVRVGAVRGGQS
jgi:hypothetical protein